MKTVVIRTREEARGLVKRLDESAERAKGNLHELMARGEGALALLATLKFEPAGCDPLDPDRPLNLVEQLNQTFTYKAAFQAVEWLLVRHPEHAPFTLNLGTSSGTDVVSEDGQIAAEVFAAVDPQNNRKLQNDIERVRGNRARFKYVLYISPSTGGQPEQYEDGGILVCRLGAV
jgi:hypothetical protein